MRATTSDTEDMIRREAAILAPYLVDRPPPDEAVERYVRAHRILPLHASAGADAAIMSFTRHRPWAIPFLDAVGAILRPDLLLRRKLLVMAAILETMPQFADRFLPRHTSTPRALIALAGYGTAAFIKTALGLPLYAAIVWIKR